jgi:hypothetical protein
METISSRKNSKIVQYEKAWSFPGAQESEKDLLYSGKSFCARSSLAEPKSRPF